VTSTFYFGSAYNLPNEPGGGARKARSIINLLERITDWHCTSRWPWSPFHGVGEIRTNVGPTPLTIATTDLVDIGRADVVILLANTGTCRGMHVELGVALALDKPVFLHRHGEGTAFDSLTKPWEKVWEVSLEEEADR